jgi:Tol biopolymer transport system component
MALRRWITTGTVVLLGTAAALTGGPSGLLGSAAAAPDSKSVAPGHNGRIAFVDNEGFVGSGPNIWLGSRNHPDWTLTQVTRSNRDTAPAWSPQGTRIAFNRGADVWLMSSSGANRHRIASAALSPTWSPNGNRLAVVRTRALWTLSDSGGQVRRLTSPPASCRDSMPDWSPLGTVVLFQRTCQGKPTAWNLVSVSNMKITTVTREGAKGAVDHPSRLRFMPDGKHVAFTSLCSAPGHCNKLYANVMVATLNDTRQQITQLRDPKPGYCDVNDCNSGWDEAVPSPDGRDFILSFITPSGAAASCLTTLHAAFTACSLGGEVGEASWQRVR